MSRPGIRRALAAAALLACAGCGYKGPLYLPERNATVVTHPEQSAPGTPAAKQKGKTPPAATPPGSSAPPPAPPPQ
ncbi:MAG: LPS translocon maturation chaperone LptM [Steroidobacteraceae bacterium]